MNPRRAREGREEEASILPSLELQRQIAQEEVRKEVRGAISPALLLWPNFEMELRKIAEAVQPDMGWFDELVAEIAKSSLNPTRNRSAFEAYDAEKTRADIERDRSEGRGEDSCGP